MISNTIAEELGQRMDKLTRAERQLSDTILENYPVSGLGSITDLAARAEVSTPTVARLVKKLGLAGFPQFQAQLRRELQAKISGPIAKHDRWAGGAPDAHILNRFTDAVLSNIRQTLGNVDIESFDEACAFLADEDRSIYVVGGRITRAMADYFFLHMQVTRPNITHIQSISNAWPHYLLNIKKGDVVVVFDVRRYENSTLKLAEMAADKGAEIILMTDRWISPVSKFTKRVFASHITVPSAWDSSVSPLLLVETMIAQVQELRWPETKERMEALEAMFDATKFFRKFT